MANSADASLTCERNCEGDASCSSECYRATCDGFPATSCQKELDLCDHPNPSSVGVCHIARCVDELHGPERSRFVCQPTSRCESDNSTACQGKVQGESCRINGFTNTCQYFNGLGGNHCVADGGVFIEDAGLSCSPQITGEIPSATLPSAADAGTTSPHEDAGCAMAPGDLSVLGGPVLLALVLVLRRRRPSLR